MIGVKYIPTDGIHVVMVYNDTTPSDEFIAIHVKNDPAIQVLVEAIDRGLKYVQSVGE